MLNFRTTSVALVIFSALVLILLFFNIRLGMFPVLAVIVWLILLAIGSVNICSGFYIRAFCRGKTDEKVISLTFDDGPDPGVTPEILKVLKRHNIPGTFFVIGQKAEKEAKLMMQIIEEGHVVGVHSYSHAFLFDLYGRKKMERDLVRTEEIINQIAWKQGGREAGRLGGMEAGRQGSGEVGIPGFFFRPPYGVTNPVVARVVKKLGYRVIGWSLRSFDTMITDEKKLTERVLKGLHPGAVVLMHDDREITAKVLEDIILKIKEKGYRFVGIEEMTGVKDFRS